MVIVYSIIRYDFVNTHTYLHSKLISSYLCKYKKDNMLIFKTRILNIITGWYFLFITCMNKTPKVQLSLPQAEFNVIFIMCIQLTN